MKKGFSEWGVNAIAMLSGIVGSLISISVDEKEKSFRSAAAQLLCGAGFSGFGAEFLANWLKIADRPNVLGIIGLVLGIAGMYVAKGIIKMGKRFESNPTKFIKNKGGGDGTGS
ncbi:MAG: hypothetical protein QM642_07570 [Edaphocola sp.]